MLCFHSLFIFPLQIERPAVPNILLPARDAHTFHSLNIGAQLIRQPRTISVHLPRLPIQMHRIFTQLRVIFTQLYIYSYYDKEHLHKHNSCKGRTRRCLQYARTIPARRQNITTDTDLSRPMGFHMGTEQKILKYRHKHLNCYTNNLHRQTHTDCIHPHKHTASYKSPHTPATNPHKHPHEKSTLPHTKHPHTSAMHQQNITEHPHETSTQLQQLLVHVACA